MALTVIKKFENRFRRILLLSTIKDGKEVYIFRNFDRDAFMVASEFETENFRDADLEFLRAAINWISI